MDEGWRAATERVQRSFDRVADRYRQESADELDRKPFDSDLLDVVARRLACDLARLPVASRSLGAVVAFYCLIYGPADHLDAVFADWHRALEPGGVAVVAVHAGDGSIHVDEWYDRPVDITVVLRDPDDMAGRLERGGFSVQQRTVRPPYDDEHPTDRLYLVAARG